MEKEMVIMAVITIITMVMDMEETITVEMEDMAITMEEDATMAVVMVAMP